MNRFLVFLVPIVLMLVFTLLGCAPGDARFSPDTPAGFWAGLWHGMISLVTLIIGLFSDSVGVFEPNNRGWGYEAGFWLGIVMMAGGIHRGASQPRRRARDKEWEEIGKKMEAKFERMLRRWAESEPDEAWDAVETKAEAKLKREIRKWADEP